MRSRILEKYKLTLKLTTRQHEVLIGLLLGDGHIEQPYITPRARLKVEQRIDAKEYVEWLYDIFHNWIRSSIRTRSKFLKSTGKTYKSCEFTTFSHEELMFYRELFYPSGKKVIPINIYDLLTPLGLAIWFMDDGSIKSHESKGRILNTHSFSKKEVLMLCAVLQNKFNLQAWPRKQKDGIQIYISGHSSKILQQLLEPHVIPMMRYKLPLYSR
jgi:hypothetical protein